MLPGDHDVVRPVPGDTGPAGRLGPPGERMRTLFPLDGELPEVEAGVTTCIERFLRSARVSSEFDDDALAARFHGSEIDEALRALTEVQDCVVVPGDDAHEGKRIVAYVVPATGAAADALVPRLRAALVRRLPEHMKRHAMLDGDATWMYR